MVFWVSGLHSLIPVWPSVKTVSDCSLTSLISPTPSPSIIWRHLQGESGRSSVVCLHQEPWVSLRFLPFRRKELRIVSLARQGLRLLCLLIVAPEKLLPQDPLPFPCPLKMCRPLGWWRAEDFVHTVLTLRSAVRSCRVAQAGSWGIQSQTLSSAVTPGPQALGQLPFKPWLP